MRRQGVVLISAVLLGFALLVGGFLMTSTQVCDGQNQLRSTERAEAHESKVEDIEEAREERDETLMQLEDPAVVAVLTPELVERGKQLAREDFRQTRERERRDLEQTVARYAPIDCFP